MEHVIEFVDAQEMAKLHPATFEAPNQSELDGIAPGQHVKVCTGDERFWVMVGKVAGQEVEGMVDNDLICTDVHGFSYGDVIRFEKRHIYSVFFGMSLPYVKPEELDTFLNDDQPTRCPLCQSRTDFLSQHDRQLHWCLNKDCQLIFMTEDDNDG